jgi:hypothetical protein
MQDFEVHDRDYVAHLKERIYELESGACRFNCRSEKGAFIDGFRYGIVRMCKEVLGSDYPATGWNSEDRKIAELAYKEYKAERNVTKT